MDEIAGGDDHGGNRGFHVGCTPPVKAAVPYGRRERIGRPFFNGAGRHDVGVAGEDKRGRVPCRAQRLVTSPERIVSHSKPAAASRDRMICWHCLSSGVTEAC